MLLELLIHTLLWMGCTAVPIWGYYQNPGLYELKRVQPYEPRGAWQTGQQDVDERLASNRGYEYNVPLLRYDDSEEEGGWQEEAYNPLNGGYDVWSDGDLAWPEKSRDYGTEDDDVDFNKLNKALQRWQEQETEKNERYLDNPDTFYIQVDDDSNQWQREPADTAMLERMLEGKPEVRPNIEDQSSIGYGQSNNELNLFQQIGMRLVDLTEDGEAKEVESTESEKVEELDDAVEKRADEEEHSMTKEKARSLLKQLQEVESERENGDDETQSEEPLDQAELEEMLNKGSSSDETEESARNSEPEHGDDSKRETGEVEQSKEELEKTELELIKEENKILIEVLRRTPIELISSAQTIAEVKALIGSAASRQRLIDYIDSQISDRGFN